MTPEEQARHDMTSAAVNHALSAAFLAWIRHNAFSLGSTAVVLALGALAAAWIMWSVHDLDACRTACGVDTVRIIDNQCYCAGADHALIWSGK